MDDFILVDPDRDFESGGAIQREVIESSKTTITLSGKNHILILLYLSYAPILVHDDANDSNITDYFILC
jgi:hypothetical protein